MELVGTSEIAALAGVSRSAVTNWVSRDSSFPQPVAVLACGQIWEKTAIDRWLTENGYSNSGKADALPELKIGGVYSHDFICTSFGGDAKSGTYLPQSQQTILCGCFTIEMNPEAPEWILIGNKNKVIKKAERLESQGGSIPVFLKLGTNQWEYQGQYELVTYSRAPEIFREKAREAQREDIVGALNFRRCKAAR